MPLILSGRLLGKIRAELAPYEAAEPGLNLFRDQVIADVMEELDGWNGGAQTDIRVVIDPGGRLCIEAEEPGRRAVIVLSSAPDDRGWNGRLPKRNRRLT